MKRLIPFLFACCLAAPAIAEVTSYDQPIHDAARTGSGDDVVTSTALDAQGQG